jgi:hypothetical protein
LAVAMFLIKKGASAVGRLSDGPTGHQRKARQ